MKKGFTLIELMIVIVMIGILLTIAIPQFVRIRDKQRAVNNPEWVLIVKGSVRTIQYINEEKTIIFFEESGTRILEDGLYEIPSRDIVIYENMRDSKYDKKPKYRIAGVDTLIFEEW